MRKRRGLPPKGRRRNPKLSQVLSKSLDDERKLRRDAEAKAKTLNDKFGLLQEDFDINEFNRLKDQTLAKS